MLRATLKWRDEKTWPVLLYRRESDGWKKQEFESSSFTTTSTRNNRHHPRVTSVGLRKECIIFPALRQKFSLKSETDQGTVIRRGDKILLVSKRRARAMLLQFQSLEDCLEFSDNFVQLNPRLPSKPPSSYNYESNFASRDHSCEKQDSENNQRTVNDEDHKQVVSWVVKMLHDKNFLGYVEKIENYIAETEDGLQILQGLECRELSST